MNFYNCISYLNNFFGWYFYSSGTNASNILRNNIAYRNTSGQVGDYLSGLVQDHNSWNGIVSLSDADFVSLDITQLLRPRKPDGSLPDIDFGHLVQTSDLVNAGVIVGLPYSGSAPDIGAFESVLGPAATMPEYLNAIVEDISPNLIQMSYDLTLSNIIPAPSAFKIQVNSITQTVNKVTIAGTKVQLTLTNAIRYGDIVTTAYTKPVSNPLQTYSGVQATSITTQAVTNNIDNSIPTQVSENEKDPEICIYPNPVHESLNISFQKPALSSYLMRIISLSGMIFYEEKVEIGSQNVTIPLNLRPGIYFVKLFSEGMNLPPRKLIVF